MQFLAQKAIIEVILEFIPRYHQNMTYRNRADLYLVILKIRIIYSKHSTFESIPTFTLGSPVDKLTKAYHSLKINCQIAAIKLHPKIVNKYL